MKEVEHRVRKVERFIVTRWSRKSDGQSASVDCTSYGEFDTICEANEVAEALHAREGNSISTSPEDKLTLTRYDWNRRD